MADANTALIVLVSVQGATTIVLAAATGFYAWRTHEMSVSTRRQAEVSADMAREMRQERLDQARPHLVVEWVSQTADPDLLRSVPSQIGIRVGNDGRGTAANVACRLDWPSWPFSTSQPTIDISVHAQHPVVFGRLDEAENGVEQPRISLEYEDEAGRRFRQAWQVNVEDKKGACHLGSALPTQELVHDP